MVSNGSDSSIVESTMMSCTSFLLAPTVLDVEVLQTHVQQPVMVRTAIRSKVHVDIVHADVIINPGIIPEPMPRPKIFVFQLFPFRSGTTIDSADDNTPLQVQSLSDHVSFFTLP